MKYEANATPAGTAWQLAVEREHAQSDRVREEVASDDFWRPVAHRFTPPKRGEAAPDDTVERLAELIEPGDTVLDVGAGGGRLAVPLAEMCSALTAVEPSEAMRDNLLSTVEAWGLDNVNVIGETWEDAEVDPHDVVICSHVVYTVREIEGFIRKLSAHARRTVALVSFSMPATATYLPLWPLVHGEERVGLPTLPEIEGLLADMGIEYQKTPLQEWISRPFRSREQAMDECHARLFVEPGSEKSARISEVLDESLVEVDGGLRLSWAEPHQPFIVSWQT